jgi:Na+/H+ antiporter NhaD/arsenite permease-like protein
VAIGILILVAVYVLIVFELVHRAIAALVGSFWALAFLSAVEQRPSFDDVHNQPYAYAHRTHRTRTCARTPHTAHDTQ